MNVTDLQPSMVRSTNEKEGIRYDADFSRIEELIKGSRFTREEISHLVDILNSRADNEQENKKSCINGLDDNQLVSWTHEIQKTPSQARVEDIDRTRIGSFRQNSEVQVPVGISASPIDIARAYMATRTSDGGADPSTITSTFDRAQSSNEFTRKPLLPSPPSKPSVCWPGAMVHDRHGYVTPQSERRRQRIHDLPRTPYSRTTLRRSTTRAESMYPYASTPLQQSQTSFYGQVKSRDAAIDRFGSVGPIRRIRNKFTPEARHRGSIFLSSTKETPNIATSKDFGGFLPSTQKNLELGETSGTSTQWSEDNASSFLGRGVSNPNISSSRAVRTILEHLDRNKPTPKEKEAELKLVPSWTSSEVSDAINYAAKLSKESAGELVSKGNINISGQDIAQELNKSSSKSNLVNFHDSTPGTSNAANGNATASSIVSTGFSFTPGGNAIPSFGLKGASNPLVKNLNKGVFATTTMSLQASHPQQSDGHDVNIAAIGPTGSDVTRNHVTRPSLPSISISKRDFSAVSSDNAPGFSFPISASSGVLTELPTPSIMPPLSASISTAPSYSFGTKKLSPPLVFSFPSTSSTLMNDNSDLKFSFGSDKKTTRLSFSSFEKNALCH